MNVMRYVSWLLASAVLMGCAASGPKMSEMQSSIPALAADKGRIFFYRTKSIVGGAVTADVRLNGTPVGRSSRGSFFYVDRPSGNYEVASSTETEKKLTLSLAPGETKYVRTYVGMGLFVGRIIPELVGASNAQKELADLAYVQSVAR